MDIKKELICNEIGKIAVDFILEKNIDYSSITQTSALELLSKIKTVLQNDLLDDFMMVEGIVDLFSEYGIKLEGCHDF